MACSPCSTRAPSSRGADPIDAAAPEANREAVTLRVPADPAQMGTVRILAGAVGRHAGLGVEQIEDLKLVLSELCAGVVETSGPNGFVEMRFEWELGSLSTEVRTAGSSSKDRTGDVADQRRRLLDALAPSRSSGLEGEKWVVRFRLP